MVDSPPLGDLLRKYRIDARLSQEALAERAGISARTIGDIETGIARLPRAITISLIAEALELEPEARENLRNAARRRTNARAASDVPGAPQGGPELIGRHAELGAIEALIANEAVRLITLIGGAGAGKTALALHVVRRAAVRFGDNVLVVELAGLPDATLVPTKIAVAAGIREAHGEAVTASIAAALGARPMLLVLDTFEHVGAAAHFVAELLAAAPALRMIVTSRVALRISVERSVIVGPLAVPAPDAALSVSQLAAIDGVALLVDCARRYKPEFSVTPANAAGVTELVRALDGVPFAIELAAPLLRVSSPSALARRLARPLDVLIAERADVPPRQRTMRDAIAWSYELLAPPQQQALRRLGLFASAFSFEAAQHAIADDPEADTLETLRTLAALSDQSLIRVVEYAGADPRFEVPALVRDFAVELLASAGETDALYQRLADYCTALLAESHALERDRVNAGSARLDVETPTFDVVLAWMRTTGRVASGLALAVRLHPFWWLRGAHRAGHAWLSSFLVLTDGRSDVDEALLAASYTAAAGLAQASGQFAVAAEQIHRALPLKRALGDRKAVASLLSGLGVCSRHLGDFMGAQAHLEEGLALRRELGDAVGVGQSLCDLGANAAAKGDFATAAARLEESLGVFRSLGDEVGISAALSNLAILAIHLKMPARADVFARESLRIAQAAGFDDAARVACFVLAQAALERGDAVAAASHLRDAVRTGDDVSASVPAGDVLRLQASIEHVLGRDAEAARLLGAASTASIGDIAPADQAGWDATRDAVAAALGGAFDTEWTIGRAGGVRAALAALRSGG